MWAWTWAYEHEQIYLEYYDDEEKIFLKYPMPHKNVVENIFPYVHGWKVKKRWNC